jgi:hypothetical protein
MDLDILEEIKTEDYAGEQERRIIRFLFSKGEDIGLIREICYDSSLKLNLDLVDSILEKEDFLQKDKNFVYVPSINLYVAKERTHLGKNWSNCNKLLQSERSKMLSPIEFVEFLEYTKTNLPELYKEITELRSPCRAEWLDADFKFKGNKLYINTHTFDSRGNIVPHSELLDKDTLMKNRQISLEDLTVNYTPQGLPSKKIKDGDSYYWHPRRDNNSVAWFSADSDGAYLGCGRDPSLQFSSLGVRAAKQRA